jgi:hypothetical protein
MFKIRIELGTNIVPREIKSPTNQAAQVWGGNANMATFGIVGAGVAKVAMLHLGV